MAHVHSGTATRVTGSRRAWVTHVGTAHPDQDTVVQIDQSAAAPTMPRRFHGKRKRLVHHKATVRSLRDRPQWRGSPCGLPAHFVVTDRSEVAPRSIVPPGNRATVRGSHGNFKQCKIQIRVKSNDSLSRRRPLPNARPSPWRRQVEGHSLMDVSRIAEHMTARQKKRTAVTDINHRRAASVARHPNDRVNRVNNGCLPPNARRRREQASQSN